MWVTHCKLASLARVAGAATRLRELNVASNCLASLESLPLLPALTSLNVAGNCLTHLDAAHLVQVPNLTGAWACGE